MPLANNLGKIRRTLRLSQRELSHLTKLYTPNGIDVTSISKQETGHRDITRIDMHAYSRIFKLSGNFLFTNLVDEGALNKALQSEWSPGNDPDNFSLNESALSGEVR